LNIKSLCPVFGQHEDVDVPFYVHVKEAIISSADSDTELFKIPAGARILMVAVDVSAGFDGTPTYTIEYKSGGAVANGSLGAVGRFELEPSTIDEWINATGGVLVGSCSGSTTGVGLLKIAYYIPYSVS
jgi:hypothetical protein